MTTAAQPGPDSRRILSIQSHVVSGYVGGKAAVFPLQLLGWDVDVVNTVNFSNHTGYGRFGGPRTEAADLDAIFTSLEQNGLLQPSRVLTGYIPNAQALEVVAEYIRRLKSRRPEITYLLDPVMGDAGKLYVAPDVVPLYRGLLEHATVITPNYFEVEVLTGVALTNTETLRQALKLLHHSFGVPHVVVSSVPLSEALKTAVPFAHWGADSDADLLLCVCSSAAPSRAQPTARTSEVYAFGIAQIPGYFSGVGDLFSALVLAHFDGDGSLKKATGLAVGTVHKILQDTATHSARASAADATDSEQDAADAERRVRRMRTRELRVIQNAGVIASKAEEVEGWHWSDFWT